MKIHTLRHGVAILGAVLCTATTSVLGVTIVVNNTADSGTGSLRNALAGITIGCALAMLAGSLVQSLLVGVAARDPRTVITVAVVLFVVALVAAVVPARRAARIDPAEALRAD